MLKLPTVNSCCRVLSLRMGTIVLAGLFTIVHFAALFDWTRPHPFLYQFFNLAGLVVSAAGLYGALRYRSNQLLAFSLYMWVGAVLSILGFFGTLILAFLPQGRSRVCQIIHEKPGLGIGYETCLHEFWKAALVVFPVLVVLLAIKIYFTVVAWSFYCLVQSDHASLDDVERTHYTAIVEQPEEERV
ncbi:hypothetical protein H4R33_005445 [Dimargaris cristalligena]|uniref:Tetraspanin family-domain-containing protein n=1 Tax=Dimargaris cristalligena TaxID=215637 RepID=A0A4P9ZT89_9FUNG|nr:hypothetical protein H4R33_005445 [Dimargaris cristalligena]RKP36418.1 hypothetical protein BJ085DRAFT_31377 [Dimargaris cristalligena]|eukprot:RKP36418.1 hypothetical protein BJ085DRAFT_31377 [Dimargaris cristalligena]